MEAFGKRLEINCIKRLSMKKEKDQLIIGWSFPTFNF